MTNTNEANSTPKSTDIVEAVWIESLPKWLDDPQTDEDTLLQAVATAYIAEEEKNGAN